MGRLSSSTTTAIAMGTNQAPKAVLKLTTPPRNTAPTSATFDASGSWDPAVTDNTGQTRTASFKVRL